MGLAARSTRASVEGRVALLSDAELLGREVAHVDGLRLGRIEAVVHQLDGDRLAVLRRQRWSTIA
jgi:hypothetical protein